MSKSIVVTGANRGIGFQITKLYAEDASFSHVFATARTPSKATELQEIVKKSNGKVIIVELDVTQETSIRNAAKDIESKLNGKGLDILVNNIGICERSDDLTKNLRENFETNVVSVQILTDALLPLLSKSKEKKIVNISSGSGSLEESPKTAVQFGFKFTYAGYSASKAALNMLSAFYSAYYGPQGFTVIPLHPGFVSTDMNAALDPELLKHAIKPEESGRSVVNVINKITSADNGKFFSYDGSILPW